MTNLPTVDDVAKYLVLRCGLRQRYRQFAQPDLEREVRSLAQFLRPAEMNHLFRTKGDLIERADVLAPEDRERLLSPGYIVKGIYGFEAKVSDSYVQKLSTRGSVFGTNLGLEFDPQEKDLQFGKKVLDDFLKGSTLKIYDRMQNKFFFGHDYDQRNSLVFVEHQIPIDFNDQGTLADIGERLREYRSIQVVYPQKLAEAKRALAIRERVGQDF